MIRSNNSILQSVHAFLMSALMVVAAPSPAQAQSSAVMRIGQSVHVSQDLPKDAHYEMEIAANPDDANQLMACSMLFPNGYAATEDVTYVSLDKGRTWKATLRTRGENHLDSWDPSCEYGPGIAYSLSEGLQKDSHPERSVLDLPIRSYNRIDVSTDGGKTWREQPRSIHAERMFISVDRRPGEANGRVYLYGMGGGNQELRFGWSPDQGKTVFSQIVRTGDNDLVPGAGRGVILSDGTLLVPFPIQTGKDTESLFLRKPGNLKIVRAEFDRPNWPLKTSIVTVAPWYMDREVIGSYLPRLAVDGTDGPFRDRTYVTWEDRGNGRYNVYLAYSTDKGKTWSKPRLINDDAPRYEGAILNGPDDIQGIVAVNTQGVVGVMWLDRRDDPRNLGWKVRFRTSLDGGESFLPSVQVSDVDYDPNRNDPMPLFPASPFFPVVPELKLGVGAFVYDGGHTHGLAADAEGRFHPLWVANPNGVPQLWTTDITVAGKAQKNGSAELASLNDVSKTVRVEFINRFYTLKTHTLDADVQLNNGGDKAVTGPVKVKVLDVSSEFGPITTTVSGKETTPEGQVWDFSPLMQNGKLEPGEVTKPLHVHFIVRGFDSFRPVGLAATTSLVSLKAKVLAASPPESGKPKNPGGAAPSADPDIE